jgi:chlorite dismutase
MYPQAPQTLDGSAVLHQMFRVKWAPWRALPAERRREIASAASSLFGTLESRSAEEGQSACFSLLGHKGDLLIIHFRKSVDELNRAELALAATELAEYLEPTSSYLSIVELGLYEATVRTQTELAQKGIAPGSDEWTAAIDAMRAEMRGVMKKRLSPAIPARRYVCFYPMDKRRGEAKNWYREPIERRAQMMLEHGKIGRQYATRVTQIISGSIGLDDWEWGVDLFADDPAVFKQLVYEMRFDEASADYGAFGAFFLGLRFPAAALGEFLAGTLPAMTAVSS